MSVPSARLPRGSWRAGWTRERTQGASQPFERASRGISLPSRCLKRPQPPAAATPGSTPAAPSSSPPPWTARSPDGALRSSAPSRACGRPPSPTRLRGPRRPRRPRGRWRARRVGTAVASCAPEPAAGLGRLGEPHRDRKVGGRGANPLAPTRSQDTPKAGPGLVRLLSCQVRPSVPRLPDSTRSSQAAATAVCTVRRPKVWPLPAPSALPAGQA